MNLNVCVKCEVELMPSQNGVVAVTMSTQGILEFRQADTWHCPVCGVELIIGAGVEASGTGFHENSMARLAQGYKDAGKRLIPYWLNAREKTAYLQQILGRPISGEGQKP